MALHYPGNSGRVKNYQKTQEHPTEYDFALLDRPPQKHIIDAKDQKLTSKPSNYFHGKLIQPFYILVDSRDRDRHFYGNANNFMVQLYQAYINVYRISLVKAWIPHVGTENHVVISLEAANASAVNQPEFASPLPNNAIGVINLEHPIGTELSTWWRENDKDVIECIYPEPLRQLNRLHIGLWIWGGVGLGAAAYPSYPSMIPYPLVTELLPLPVAPPEAPVVQDRNVVYVFRIECERMQ